MKYGGIIMAYELFDAFKNDEKVAANDIILLKKGFNRKTGSLYIKATTVSGETFIKEFTSEGKEITPNVSIPRYETKKQRDKIIKELYANNHTQVEISDMLGISQSTVHNILKKEN